MKDDIDHLLGYFLHGDGLRYFLLFPLMFALIILTTLLGLLYIGIEKLIPDE